MTYRADTHAVRTKQDMLGYLSAIRDRVLQDGRTDVAKLFESRIATLTRELAELTAGAS